MTKLLVVLAIAVATGASLHAQRAEFQLVARNTTPIATNEFPFILGADVQATDGADSTLGEIEIPSIPLPGDIYYVWTIVEAAGEEIWLSPKDLRPLRPERYIDTFELHVQWTGGKLDFLWPGVKPAFIDSAYIIDAVLDFPNNVFIHKLWTGEVAETNNPALDKFLVLVWFDGRTLDVDDNNARSLTIGPVPFFDMLRIRGEGALGTVRLYDTQARLVAQQQADGGDVVLSTAHLTAGPYIVELTDMHGASRRKLIVRQ